MRLVWPVALGLALGVALALAPAPGAEAEAREVEVAGSSVRVRELAAVCGGQPDSRGLDQVIAADLRPGERRLVTAADIRARLSDLGFSDCGRPAAGEAVMVRRSARVLSASELIARISSHFRISDLQVREPEIEDTVRRIYEERLLEKME